MVEDVFGGLFFISSVVLFFFFLNGSSSKMFLDIEKDDLNDDKKNGKCEKMFFCFKRMLSSCG